MRCWLVFSHARQLSLRPGSKPKSPTARLLTFKNAWRKPHTFLSIGSNRLTEITMGSSTSSNTLLENGSPSQAPTTMPMVALIATNTSIINVEGLDLTERVGLGCMSGAQTVLSESSVALRAAVQQSRG